MSGRKGHYMQTASGRAYWPLDPRPEDITIEDIAHALGHICRYGGHCLTFYSVAEHSVLVSRLVPPEHALKALLHDAPEAYCGDVVRPLKKHLTDYAGIEELNWRAVCDRFGMTYDMPQCIHDADVALLFAEQAAIMPATLQETRGMGLTTPLKADPASIFGYMPGRATERFLARFNELYVEALV